MDIFTHCLLSIKFHSTSWAVWETRFDESIFSHSTTRKGELRCYQNRPRALQRHQLKMCSSSVMPCKGSVNLESCVFERNPKFRRMKYATNFQLKITSSSIVFLLSSRFRMVQLMPVMFSSLTNYSQFFTPSLL
jgi:hypothetical protein